MAHPAPKGRGYACYSNVPKWNMRQILVEQMLFYSIPLRVHGKVVILQAENQSYVFPFK